MTTPIRSGRNTCFDPIDDDPSPTPPEANECRVAGEDHEPVTEEAETSSHAGANSAGCNLAGIAPDYYTASGSAGVFVGSAVSVTIVRYENVYVAGGGSIADEPGVGGAVMAGYLRDAQHPCTPPTQEELQSFLGGSAVTALVGDVVGVARTISNGREALEVGFATPQAGVSQTVGARWQ